MARMIDARTKRNLVIGATALAAANSVVFLDGLLSGFMNTEIIGNINIATLIGAVALYGVHQWWKRRL